MIVAELTTAMGTTAAMGPTIAIGPTLAVNMEPLGTPLWYLMLGTVIAVAGLVRLLLVRDLVARIIALNVTGAGSLLILLSLGARQSPADPVFSALVITGLVITVAFTGLGAVLIRRIESDPESTEENSDQGTPDRSDPGTSPGAPDRSDPGAPPDPGTSPGPADRSDPGAPPEPGAADRSRRGDRR